MKAKWNNCLSSKFHVTNGVKQGGVLSPLLFNVNFRNNVPNVVVEGNLVEQVDHAKRLGITLSNDLTWNKHVDNIVKKAAKRVYMIYHLKRSGISQTDLVKVYM